MLKQEILIHKGLKKGKGPYSVSQRVKDLDTDTVMKVKNSEQEISLVSEINGRANGIGLLFNGWNQVADLQVVPENTLSEDGTK